MRTPSFKTSTHFPSSHFTQTLVLSGLAVFCRCHFQCSPVFLLVLILVAKTVSMAQTHQLSEDSFSKHLNRWTWHKSSCFSAGRRQECTGIRSATSAVLQDAVEGFMVFPIGLCGETYLQSVHLCTFKNIPVSWKEYRSYFRGWKVGRHFAMKSQLEPCYWLLDKWEFC